VRAARIEQVDPRDGARPLDVKEVDTQTDGTRSRFSILTWSRWRTHAIHDRAFLVIHLYTRPGGGPDYAALLRSNGRHMRGILLRSSGARRERAVGSFPVWRNDSRSVSLRLPLKKLGPPQPGGYAWYVETIATSKRCKRVCFDRAPDQGAVPEPLPLPPQAPVPPSP
jgi:hypothetical protein